jgi:predicted nucleotidyltransferase
MKKAKVKIPRKKIAEFCQRWKIVEFDLFGSILREDFRPDSDVDVLVIFAPDAKIGLFDIVSMQKELQEIFNRDVDLIEKASLKNPYRKREILETSQRIYAS